MGEGAFRMSLDEICLCLLFIEGRGCWSNGQIMVFVDLFMFVHDDSSWEISLMM